jgi:hypothetical protein
MFKDLFDFGIKASRSDDEDNKFEEFEEDVELEPSKKFEENDLNESEEFVSNSNSDIDQEIEQDEVEEDDESEIDLERKMSNIYKEFHDILLSQDDNDNHILEVLQKYQNKIEET